jgi:RimJ/RimL family protein N-acetyltransferase
MVGYLPLPPSDTPRRALVPVSPAEPTADPDEADHERIGTSSSGPPGPEPEWRPLKPPLIVVDPSFVLDRWRPNDGVALRRFDLDPETARFFGYTVEQAKAMPDSHYDGDMRARGNLRAWRAGKQLNLAIRRRADGEAVGWVELQPVGNHAEVSYNVSADLRGQGIAPVRSTRFSPGQRNTSTFAAPTSPPTSTTWPLDAWRRSAASSLSAGRAMSTSSSETSTPRTSWLSTLAQ